LQIDPGDRGDRPTIRTTHHFQPASRARCSSQTHCITVGTFTWRGKTTPIAIRVRQDGLLLQRLYFADEVHDAAEIDRGAEPRIRDQERTLAERLIGELSGAEFHPENYEDEYWKRLLKAIEQKVAG
jgi:non-homologous end joining protein Ku